MGLQKLWQMHRVLAWNRRLNRSAGKRGRVRLAVEALDSRVLPAGTGIGQIGLTPVIDNLSPDSALEGSPDLVLTVNGSNFISGRQIISGDVTGGNIGSQSGSFVEWTDAQNITQELPTTFVNSNELQATVPAADLAEEGTAQVTVVNVGQIIVIVPGTGGTDNTGNLNGIGTIGGIGGFGGQTSNSVTFTITDPFTINQIPDQEVPRNADTQTFDLSSTIIDNDVDGPEVLAFSAAVVNPGDSPDLVTASVSGSQLTLNFAPDQDGSAQVTVVGQDPFGNAGQYTFNVTVQSVDAQADALKARLDELSAEGVAGAKQASQKIELGTNFLVRFDPSQADEAFKSAQDAIPHLAVGDPEKLELVTQAQMLRNSMKLKEPAMNIEKTKAQIDIFTQGGLLSNDTATKMKEPLNKSEAEFARFKLNPAVGSLQEFIHLVTDLEGRNLVDSATGDTLISLAQTIIDSYLNPGIKHATVLTSKLTAYEQAGTFAKKQESADLDQKVVVATRKFAEAKPDDVIDTIRDFINRVTDLSDRGDITPDVAKDLLSEARLLLGTLIPVAKKVAINP